MSGFFPEKWGYESGHTGSHVYLQTYVLAEASKWGGHMQRLTHTRYTLLSHVSGVP